MAAHPNRTEDLQQASFLIILAVVSLLMTVIVWPFAQPLLWAALAAIPRALMLGASISADKANPCHVRIRFAPPAANMSSASPAGRRRTFG